MMGLSLKTDDRVLKELIRSSDEMAEDVLSQLADSVISQWTDAIRDTPVRADKRSKRGKPPAKDTGELIDSFEVDVDARSAVISGDSYALFLNDNMDRPFIEDGLPSDSDVEDVFRRVWAARRG